MITAKEYLEEKWKGALLTRTDIEEFLTDYATQACKEQRTICANEAKVGIFSEDEDFVTKDTITKSIHIENSVDVDGNDTGVGLYAEIVPETILEATLVKFK